MKKRQSVTPATKMIKLRAIKGNEKSPWRGSHYFANHPEEETNSQT
jgi:predicted RNA binding protein YcfA (HicA-like mRNA interferase family)